MAYSAVIFDLIATLVPFSAHDLDRVFKDMAAALNLPLTDYQQACAEVRLDWEAGAFGSVEAHAEHVCRALERAPDARRIAAASRRYLDFAQTALTPRPDAVETLRRLREAGYVVGVISNCSSEIPLLWPATELAPLVDAAVFSCDVGVRKPDPRIYARACERLSVAPGRCLYVGDGGSRELTGALACGMSTVQLRPPGERPEDRARLGREPWDGAAMLNLTDVFSYLGAET